MPETTTSEIIVITGLHAALLALRFFSLVEGHVCSVIFMQCFADVRGTCVALAGQSSKPP